MILAVNSDLESDFQGHGDSGPRLRSSKNWNRNTSSGGVRILAIYCACDLETVITGGKLVIAYPTASWPKSCVTL